jgi:hypothetical protein
MAQNNMAQNVNVSIMERWMIDSHIELNAQLDHTLLSGNHENYSHILNNFEYIENAESKDSTKEVCYIKRTGGEWQRASPHHYAAYMEYLNTINRCHAQLIEVPHSLGGDFVAWFFETQVKGMFRYDDEFGRNTHIRMFSEL